MLDIESEQNNATRSSNNDSVINGVVSDILSFLEKVKEFPIENFKTILLEASIKSVGNHELYSATKELASKLSVNIGSMKETNETHISSYKIDKPVEINMKKDITPFINDKIVQIKADKSEIERRITSFMTQKQSEVNELNNREFSVEPLSTGESCARTEAVFIARSGSKSHIKISRVENCAGPQTQEPSTNMSAESNISTEPQTSELIIQKRLNTIENHIHINGSSKNISERLKKVEEKILFLESISPEYFNGPPVKKFKNENMEKEKYDDHTLADIENKIKMLQQYLCKQ